MRWNWDFIRDRRTEVDNRFLRLTKGLVAVNGSVRQVQGIDLSDMEVAAQVRMLTRHQPDHESVCTLARDRIVYLADRLGKIEALTAEDIGRAVLEVERDFLRPRLGIEPRGWDDLEEPERELHRAYGKAVLALIAPAANEGAQS
jgi:hypothetical protein